MKRSMLFTLLVALLAMWVIPGFAQTLEYGFTSTMGTYAPISGGLQLGTETTDDQRFTDPADLVGGTTTTGPGLPIGFDFMFNGAIFDRLAVNANGWVSFGQSALTPSVNNTSSSSYTPIASTSAITPAVLSNRVAVMARDLQAQTGATIRMETIGAAPNRVCVVQWENYKKYGTSGTGDLLNFQVQLHETANNVKIVYGNITANATVGNMQVGLRGPEATDFNARQGDGAWTNTSAASANTQYVVLNDVNYPANGLTFTFTYPVANSAPNPANIVSPANGATLVSPFASLNWMSGGGLPDGFRLSLGTNNPPTNLVNNVDLGAVNSYSPTPVLNISTTYYWQIVPYNTFGSAANCPVWSFTTHGDANVNALPYIQHWDAVTAPALPFDWSAIVNSSSTTAYVQTSTSGPHSAPNNVQIANSGDAEAQLFLVSPQIHQSISMQSIRVKAWLRPLSTSYVLELGVMSNPTDPSTFQLVHTFNFANTTYAEYAVPLTGYTGTGRFIAFRHGQGGTYRTFYVDEVTFEAIAANDMAATAITGNTTPSVGTPANYTISVLNNGTASQSTYQVKLFNAANTELASVAGPTIAGGATADVQITWTPSTQGPESLYGKVVLAGDVNSVNNQTPPLQISVQPEGVMTVTIGEGNLAEGVPFEFYYKCSLFQTLYYATEIGMYGNITAVSFYNNFITNLANKPIKLWLGTTMAPDLATGLIDPTTLTLVYDGTMNFPSGENTITIPLQMPFNYSGGNLVLYANRPLDAGYFSSSDDFQAQTVGTNRARKIQSDSIDYDPMAPSSIGTLSGTFPKTTFIMTPLSPNPTFIVNPPEKDFGLVILGVSQEQTFFIANAGGGTLGVNSISISGNAAFTLSELPTLPQALVTGQTASFLVTYAPVTAGEHSAVISIVDNVTRQTHTVQLDGEGFDATITQLPAIETWDTVTVPNFPLGWSTIQNSNATTTYLQTTTSAPFSLPNCVQLGNSTDTTAELYLISPPIATTIPVSTIRVKLMAKGGAGYLLHIGTMSNPTDPTTFVLAEELTVVSNWNEYVVNLTNHTPAGQYIAVRHGLGATYRTLYVDDVSLELIAPNDLAATMVSGNSTPSLNAATPYIVTVFNNGTAPQSTYNVKLFDGNNVELATAAGPTIAAGATAEVILSWTPSTEGPMSIYGKVFLTGDVNPANDASNPMAISVQPAGIISVTIGDGSQTDRMPLDFFWRNSVYQNIYYPTEIGLVGNISTLSLYNQFTTASMGSKPVKIWMGLTTQPDLNAGWISSTAMTLVFDGTVNFPGGANTITFPLQTPFAYTGGNLVVMFNRPMDTQYYSSSDYFKTQTGVTGRARGMYSDSTLYDPANLTGGTVTGVFPKTTLTLIPMTGDPVFMLNPSTHNFGDVNIGGSRSQNFTIVNAGGGTLGINEISIAGSPTMALSNVPTLPAALATGETVIFTITYTPTSLEQNTATVTVIDNLGTRHQLGGRNTLRSTEDSTREAHTVTLSGTGVNDITIGSGNLTGRVPMDFFYKNSLFQTIYYADELSNFVGMITGVKFYNQFTTNLPAMPVKIWLASTTLNDLSADWIPSTDMTLVYDGMVDFPSGENVISITFPENFMFLDGGNLLMMVKRPMDTGYYSSTDYFKTQTVGANRARNVYSDSVDYDPAAPTGGTASGTFPKTTFAVIPGGVGDITGTVVGAGSNPLADVLVNVNGRPYSTTTNAQGQFSIINVLPGNYAVSFSRHGYVDQSINIVLDEDEVETMNVTMNLMAQVNVTGSILASDTGAGIAGANINLVGYENYSGSTAANGTFTIPTVFANQNYSYSITAAGYTSTNGIINVGATNYSMGNITLSEVAYAPNSVVATPSIDNSSVLVEWNVPDPNAIEITESFEAATFPPDGWTQAITNQGAANSLGVLPTWCSFGNITITGSGTVIPTDGSKQAGLWWAYEHQDEWLMTPAFNCPPDAHLSFDTYAQLGSVNNDHYYVKISVDGGTSWSVLWDASAQTAGENYYAYPITIDLASYAGGEVILAFNAMDPPSNDGLWYVWFIDNIYIGNFVEDIRFAGSDLSSKSIAKTKSSAFSSNTPDRLTRADNIRTINNNLSSRSLRASSRTTNRALVGYRVWRLAAGQENNEATWVSLNAETITPTEHIDEGWNTIPNGTYKWAVKAVYTADVMSAPAFSNPVVKEVLYGTIVGFVRRQNNQGIANATVTAVGGFSTTTNSAGAYSLVVPVGVYSITATAGGFEPYTYENITIAANQNTTVNFILVPTSNNDEVVPVTVTALKGNYPNPFNPETTISYDIKEASAVRLDVYNVKGQLVRTLVNQDQASGRYRVVFNGRDEKGSPLSSGIYLYRFTAGSYSNTRKMMLME